MIFLDTDNIESIIGYKFKDLSYLNRAFTHSSVSSNPSDNYQVLEFLGDSILNFIVGEILIEHNPTFTEGDLTVNRSKIVSKEPLSEIIVKLDLNKYLQVREGEDYRSIIASKKVQSDIFESILGAIYLDSNDLSLCKEFINRFLGDSFNSSIVDYKSELYIYCSRNNLSISFDLVQDKPLFNMVCKLDNKIYGQGIGHTKKEAEKNASKQTLEMLKV